jgi:predicted RNase H-like HicB family nuclease
MQYTVVLNREDDGRYSVWVPALPGCATFGETVDEALAMVEEAIAGYIESLAARGLPIPPDTSKVNVDSEEYPVIMVQRVQVGEGAPVA